ncbi:SEC14-like protein 1 isoform X2 [Artemia franciscana]|uniref:SEC14-like protein 1 n=1 Tax=Artemia franciscana TaxID=6661 RepID=A0AA88LD34_ARTSF|nr:hypothetical protein QYM36_007707 [Artemia franciscana]
MVQTYQSPVRVYKHPFELIMEAYQRRFPTTHLMPILVSSEIVNETLSEDKAQHVVERLCKLGFDVPYLLKKLTGVDYVNFRQKNSLDRRKRTLHIETFNESFSNRLIIKETCVYSVHPDNPNWTCFEQAASLDVKSFFGFESIVEKIAVKQYSQSIAKGKEIIEYYLKELEAEGITYVPPFKDASSLKVPAILTTSYDDDKEQSCGGASISSEVLNIGASASTVDLQKMEKQFPVDESQFKLEAEYIQRYLGELTPLQESRLIQLRTWVAELQKGKVPSDMTLLRFLRARDFAVDKAREMLSQSLVWRKKYQVDKILSEYQIPRVIKEYFPGSWHHTDKDGRPLYLLCLGQMDVKGLVKSVGEEGLLKLTLHTCEEGLRLCEEATERLGKPISSWTLLADLEGLNMRHLWRPGVQTLLRIIEIVEANYPETMGRILITRAPRVFPILWTIIGAFIDEVTRTKILFHGGTDYSEPGGLLDYIPEEYIPDFLGGPYQISSVDGSMVPKSMYMTEEQFEKERQSGCFIYDESVYKCVSLTKGQVHEEVISAAEKGGVICWDFDVTKQDVDFTVLRTKVSVPLKEQVSSPTTHGSPLDVLTSMNQLLVDSDHRSVIERSWKKDIDYFIVENPLACHEGESIQGSHVISVEGTYILQWKFNEPVNHPTHAKDFIESITSSKAKFMYYYEVLNSDDYRGSMTSLHSSQSGFSAISTTTSISMKSRKSLNSGCPSR